MDYFFCTFHTKTRKMMKPMKYNIVRIIIFCLAHQKIFIFLCVLEKIKLCIVLSVPTHLIRGRLSFSPRMPWYVSAGGVVRKGYHFLSRHSRRKTAQDSVRLKLQTLHIIDFIWVYPQVCSYNCFKRYSYVSSSKGFLVILEKQGEYKNLTQIVPFIQPQRYASHHISKILTQEVIVVGYNKIKQEI